MRLYVSLQYIISFFLKREMNNFQGTLTKAHERRFVDMCTFNCTQRLIYEKCSREKKKKWLSCLLVGWTIRNLFCGWHQKAILTVEIKFQKSKISWMVNHSSNFFLLIWPLTSSRFRKKKDHKSLLNEGKFPMRNRIRRKKESRIGAD